MDEVDHLLSDSHAYLRLTSRPDNYLVFVDAPSDYSSRHCLARDKVPFTRPLRSIAAVKRRLWHFSCRIFERARGCVSPLSDARAVATPGETALLVSSGARGDARRSGVTHAGSGARGRARRRRWAMKLWRRAPPLDAAGSGQPTRRRNTVGGSRLCSYSFSQRLLHES
ncbi:hypothetical protein EVAR_103589_1 [Eumeta japonica]|uniref:Uncharacterized protein n=1 Tax=Eumeta variegata TaxID=151549 RepID=A0A4C1Z643_EUMVA|nr:hypothetical protein EVAR_103589_1 [Eumeta japonica]